ncbi:hypothetical protein H310_04421 [Aphanomyces invadans]|uniref:DDE Tnp4 domain-containing protein n=1 Tax=Aphanomyces invadans TaxID=157072 RepID=A0A024UCV1_9STRA|nr:hypothetical protein H310_04421 [Aphanomyces invadans]ETW04035.1 hypothetical protein H310_04421 [Aphanomyces invadans]|eukprot:XP_008866991.1 hypothetical protein H310_04421 [Aphanomyces invadans]
MAGVVGAIDGTLIEILRPHQHEGFFNRHGDLSLNVQVIVDTAIELMDAEKQLTMF